MEHAPAQPEQFEVFIDALAEVDELVGEYLRLCFLTEENRVTDKEARTEAWRQLRALRAQHEVEWFGVKPKEDAWRWGIPRRLILPAKPEVLARVRSSPLGRFVSALRLEGPVEPGTLDALKGHHALRSLEVRASGLLFPIGALPLKHLALMGVGVATGSSVNAELETAALRSSTLTPAMVEVFAGPCPALSALEVFSAPEAGQGLVRKLSRQHHGALKTLGLTVASADEALERVLASGLIEAGLQSLTLDGYLSSAGFELLERHAARWASVPTLVLLWDVADDQRAQALRAQFPGLQRFAGRLEASAWID